MSDRLKPSEIPDTLKRNYGVAVYTESQGDDGCAMISDTGYWDECLAYYHNFNFAPFKDTVADYPKLWKAVLKWTQDYANEHKIRCLLEPYDYTHTQSIFERLNYADTIIEPQG